MFGRRSFDRRAPQACPERYPTPCVGPLTTGIAGTEAKTLAEGSFVDKGNTELEARNEDAEKELFAKIAPMDQEIQDKVLKDPNTKTPAPAVKDEKRSGPAYRSKGTLCRV